MERLKHPIPYNSKPIKVHQTTRKIVNQKQGVTVPIEKHAWISSGKLKNIERGLPIMSENQINQLYEKMAALDKRAKSIEDELNDNVNNLANDQITYIFPQTETNPKPVRSRTSNSTRFQKTGIFGNIQSDDIIDSIGKIHIKSVRPKTCQPKPIVQPRTKRSSSYVPSTDLIHKQIKRVFQSGTPFTNIDNEDDFPLNGLENPENSDRSLTIDSEENNSDKIETEYPSMLIDSSKYDIIWTKHKVPFTREEVNHLNAWKSQLQKPIIEKELQNQKIISDREKYIKKTFESKAAFQRQLELLESDCERIATIGPGKSKGRRHSNWEISSKKAKTDSSSLPSRKMQWNEFVKFVQENGYVKSEQQKKFCLNYRNELMKGNEIGKKMFWKIIYETDEMDFTRIEVLICVEFIRKKMKVKKEEFLEYLETIHIPDYFYLQAINELENRNCL